IPLHLPPVSHPLVPPVGNLAIASTSSTWHTLGRAADVDFPYLIWQVVHGQSVPEGRARRGVTTVTLPSIDQRER
ncbi:MAG TPA: hypothetical protein VNL16_08240, partial [Chloroflexota bacterium]|nr:hypothetical protein [Chloroflexota bacterium]